MSAGRDQGSWPRRYGKYELLERIGEGGMAEAFRARLPGAAGFEKVVVIKRILPHLSKNERFIRMFVNEAKLASQIQHQNVVQVFELGELTPGGELYMALEYVQGLDLRAILELAAQKVLRLPLWFGVHVMHQILSGLAHAHELIDPAGEPLSIIHRDVTPSNVFVSVLGEVKLADFGVAKAVGSLEPDGETTLRGQLKGKLSYAPPEQIHGETLDPRADVFSAGVVLWECLTQRRLFGGRPDFEAMVAICEEPRTPPSAFNPAVPAGLDRVVLTALERDRELRFPTARAFVEALAPMVATLRPGLSRGDVRHVLEVLRDKKPPHPALGLDLPAPRGESGADLEPASRARRRSSGPPAEPRGARVAYESDGVWMPEPPPGIAEDLRVATPPPLDADVRRATVLTPPTDPRATDAPDRLDRLDRADRPDRPDPSGPVAIPPAVSTGRGRGGVDELPRWEQEAPKVAGSGPYAGAAPFYARTSDGEVRGPLEIQAFLRLLETKEARGASVSADGEVWIPSRTLIALAGLDGLGGDRPRLKNVTRVGTLEETSLIHLFTKLTLAGASGRLVVMAGANATARREVDVVRGAPAYVWSDRADLQLPALAARHDFLPRDRLPELVHRCLREMVPVDEALRALTNTGGRYRPIFMRDRMVELLRWRQGKFALDTVAMDAPPFAASLLSGLVELVARAWTEAELLSKLDPVMGLRLEAGAELDAIVSALELPKAAEAPLDRLTEGKPLSTLARRTSGVPVLAMAMVLLESGALRPRS